MSNTQARLFLHCQGLVQGVGFRPLVHGLALRLHLVGRLDNIPGAVRLDLQGSRPALERFLQLLPQQPMQRLQQLSLQTLLFLPI